jgi:hypothetical protein
VSAKCEIMDRHLAHLRVIEDQIEPHSFHTLFVELGKGQIEFDHRLSSAEINLAHELFGIRAMANIETRKNFEWSFAFDPRFHTKQMLFVKSLRARGRELDCQRQKRAVKPKDIHPQTIWREIAFPLIADLPEREFTFPAVVENCDLIAEFDLGLNGSDPRSRKRAVPEVGPPRPIRAAGLGEGCRADTGKGQPVVGGGEQAIDLNSNLAGQVPHSAQFRKVGRVRLLGPCGEPRQHKPRKSLPFKPIRSAFMPLPS